MILIVIASYIIVIFGETAALRRDANVDKMVFYLLTSIFAMIISALLTLGIQLPSPANPIKNIVFKIFGM